MSLSNDQITAKNFKEFYERILPYLGTMPEVLANKFSKGDMYSTDEKMIGQWIDGKPLYQKVVIGTLGSKDNWSSFAHNISNFDTLVMADAYTEDDASSKLSSKIGGYRSSDVCSCLQVDNLKVYIYTSDAYANKSVTCILKYTKTTDSAISIGDDTDYSASEKIIGTWTNGKPLYQKTIRLNTNQTTYSVYNVSLSTLFPDSSYTDIIEVSGYYNQTSYNNTLFDLSIKCDTDLAIGNLSNNPMWFIMLTVKYTKTTD